MADSFWAYGSYVDTAFLFLAGTVLASTALAVPSILLRSQLFTTKPQTQARYAKYALPILCASAFVLFFLVGDTAHPKVFLINTQEAQSSPKPTPIFSEVLLSSDKTPDTIFTLKCWFIFFWLCGILIGSFRLITSFKAIKSLHENATPFGCPDLLEWIDTALLAELTKRRVLLQQSRYVNAPLTFGFTQPVILLPTAVKDIVPSERNALVAHELAHIINADFARNIALQLLKIVLWFNPFVRHLCNGYSNAMEFAADKRAMVWIKDRLCMKRALGRMSVKQEVSDLMLGAVGRPNIIISRINAIDERETPCAKLISTTGLLILVVLIAIGSLSFITNWLGQSQLAIQRSIYLSEPARFNFDDFQYFVCQQLKRDGVYDDRRFGEPDALVRLSYWQQNLKLNGVVLPPKTQDKIRALASRYGVALKDGHFFEFYSDENMVIGSEIDKQRLGERIGDPI